MGKLLLLTLNKQKEKAIDKIILGAGYKFDVKIVGEFPKNSRFVPSGEKQKIFMV